MTRAIVTLWLAVGFLLSAGFPLSACGGEKAPQGLNGAKPNIVLILTDDQDLLLNSLDYMPNVKSLITEQGITFSNDFVPLSLCCPSRTTILRGQFPHNHTIVTNTPPNGGFETTYALGLESATIVTSLHDAGYKTVLLGKYLNGYPDTASDTYIPPGWDEWYSPTKGTPYKEFNYTLNENGVLIDYGSNPSDYLTDVLLANVLSFIVRASQNPDQPIFIYFATYAPHQPATPAPRHANLFSGIQAPRRPSFNEADVSDKPEYIQEMPLLSSTDIQSIDALYRRRLQSLQAVDEAVAGIIQALQATGRLDNTYIFFTSDNGFHMGEHRFPSGKYTPYETDIRVPLMVRGPGVPTGINLEHFTGDVDFASTFADLAGTNLTVASDGRSLAPLLKPSPPDVDAWRQASLLEQSSSGNPLLHANYLAAWISGVHKGYLEPPDPQDAATAAAKAWPAHQGYETWTYKYVEYGTGEKELYVLTSDPDELQNQASSANPAIVSSLSAYLSTLKACAGAGCAAADSVVPPALLTADFTFSPNTPTDLTLVTFTASANGTAPYAYTWDLAGTPATGVTATKVFSPPGPTTVKLTVQDGITAQAAASKTITIAPSIVVSGITKVAEPSFHLVIKGSHFEPSCVVKVNGASAPQTAFKSSTQITAKGGNSLKAMLPKGVTVYIVVANPGGGQSLPIPFTR